MIPRLFIPSPLSAGQEVAAPDAQAHYLRHVLRLGEGAIVHLFNGRDGEWRALLSMRGKREVLLTPEACVRPQGVEAELTLLFAPIKRAHQDFQIEKVCELGVTRLIPVLTDHTDSQRVNLDRLQAIATEAAEQCERLTVPSFDAPQNLKAVLASWPKDKPLFWCAERGVAEGALQAMQAHHSGCSFLIGPEGGFSDAECALLRGLPFIVPITLGPRILRADTAAITVLAVWGAVWRKVDASR
jgi:16S rRNA (uracil1498-N3)-methyltransferase